MTKVMISLPTSLLIFLAIEQMDMGDVTAFRERFKAYKNGKSVSEIYDAGLPRYAGGTPGLTKAQEAALDELYEWGNSLGYDTMSIAGIGGNGLQESGLNYNAKSKSGYAGLLQNNKNIQQAIIEQYGDYSPASQRQYIHDWNTRAKWITKGKHSPHTATNSGRYKTKGYTSTDEASDAWMKLYERPVILDSNGKVIGYQEQDKRRAYTKLAYEYLNSKYGKPQIPAQEPSPYIAKPVSTAVRSTIPAEQTVPTYDTKISPYISGKPMVKLRPRVQLPNIIEVMEDSEWEPGFPGLKNGKLPVYGDGKLNALIHPVDEVRRRLYDNVFPYAYDNAANRAFSAIFKNRPDESEQFSKVFYQGNQALLDDLWGTYLQIPDNQRHQKRVLTKSKYKPSISNKEDGLYYSAPLDKQELQYIVDSGVLHGRDKDAPKLLNPDFGHYTVSRGYDNKGDYVSYYDSWDLNPFRGITSISNKYANKLGLNKIEDLSFGIGKPVELYDRIYLDDYYGVGKKDRGGIYLPEVVIQGRNKKHVLQQEESEEGGMHEYKDGKSPIYIKPANRGKFTALKKRTGHSASWFKENGTPAQKKMAVFALNAKKWKH